MGVTIKRQRNGELRPYWYGEYRDENGKRVVRNLGRWRGTPSPALLRTGPSTEGSKAFENSRRDAETELQSYQEEARRKGQVIHLVETLIEKKTGKAVEYVRIDELCDRWKKLNRKHPLSNKYRSVCDAHFARFVTFMRKRNRKAIHAYEITEQDAHEYATECRSTLADATASDTLRIMRAALVRFLPAGSHNPFDTVDVSRTTGAMIHRKPFTPDELRQILATASSNRFMSDLITTAACTGMRRGDVCNLKWRDVNLSEGMLTVKTSKTGAEVEIPIFAPLRTVLESRKGKGKRKKKGNVFPEAAKMLETNADGLSYRFKCIVARALDTEPDTDKPELTPLAQIAEQGSGTIIEHVPVGERRDRILDNLARYCDGQSFRQIEQATGRGRGSISYDLAKVSEWIGKRFVKGPPKTSIKQAIARVTRTARDGDRIAASVRDWHALRATWVTLALTAGVPVEIVRRVTGHNTVDVVLKHYFRPGREDFRKTLQAALPDVLTGIKRKRKKPADELAALANKIADGTATKRDKARLRTLAIKM